MKDYSELRRLAKLYLFAGKPCFCEASTITALLDELDALRELRKAAEFIEHHVVSRRSSFLDANSEEIGIYSLRVILHKLRELDK